MSGSIPDAGAGKSGKRRVVLLSLALFLPALTLIAFMLVWFHRNDRELRMTEISSNAFKTLLERQQLLSKQQNEIVADLHFMADLPSVHEIVRDPRPTTIHHIAKVIISLSDVRASYRKIRILDLSGREILVVVYTPETGAVAVPDSSLQPQAGRDFFTEAIKLGRSDVYVSPFELSGGIGPKHSSEQEPVLRYATQIRGHDGPVEGILAISCSGNLLASHKLDNEPHAQGNALLLTSEGDYISGSPDGTDWQFLRKRGEAPASFRTYYPDEWQTIGRSPSGQFTTRNGLFTFRRLDISKPVGKSDATGNRNDYWIMVQHIPHNKLEAMLPPVWNAILLASAVGIIFFSGAMTLSVRIERNRSARKALEVLAGHLQEKESRFRMLFRGAPEPIFLIDVLSGCIEGVNDKAIELTGLPEHTLIGKPFTLLHPDELDAEVRECFRQQIQEARKASTSYPREALVSDLGGKRIPVEIVSQLIQLDGREIMYRIYHDISRRKRTESELHDKTQLLETVTDAVPALVYMKDRQGRYRFVNRYCLENMGCSTPDVIVGKRDRDFFPAIDADVYEVDDLNVIMQGKAIINKEEVVVFPGHPPMPVLTNKIPLVNASGEIEGLVGISMDRTAQKEADERSRELEHQLRNRQKLEMLGTLSGGIAHDFNNILTPIIGFTELAISDLPKESEVVSELEYVLKGAQRAKKMVQHMLVFSRKQPTDFRPQKLQPVVWESIDFLKHSLPAYVVMENRIDEFEDLVLCDASQIQQIVMNLCTNGWQAMEEHGGRLVVELHRTVADVDIASRHEGLETGHSYVLLKVSDAGKGMSREVIDRMFDPFFTTKAVGKGTGLGLSVVYGIIMDHHGVILVESEEGRGTAISVYLPVAESMVESTGNGVNNLTEKVDENTAG